MAATTAGATPVASWTPYQLNVHLPTVAGSKSASAGESSADIVCTALYTHTLKNTECETPQRFDICVPATAVPDYDAGNATEIRLGELCLSDVRITTGFDCGWYTHIKFSPAASSSKQTGSQEEIPRLGSVTANGDSSRQPKEVTGRDEWRFERSQRRSTPSLCKLEFRFLFHISILHLRVNGLSSRNEDVNPALKLSLLASGNATSDLNLICKDGSKVPAHSAILASVPYFATKLKEDWSGTGWNLNNRLDLELPIPVTPNVLQTFLEVVYGDPGALRQLDPSDAASMQDTFSLAEACGVLPLCSAVDSIAQITPESAYSWLEWLSQEHGADTSRLRERAKSVVSTKFCQPSFWKNLGINEVLALETAVRTLKVTVPEVDSESEPAEVESEGGYDSDGLFS